MAKLAPLERLRQPEDIAATVASLAGPDGAWINGQTMRANSGIVWAPGLAFGTTPDADSMKGIKS